MKPWKLVFVFAFLVFVNLFLLSIFNKQRIIDSSINQRLNQLSTKIPTPNQQEIKLVFGGDVMLGRSVMQKYMELNDFTYPFKYISDTLKSADLAIVNLENPVIAECPIHVGGYKFCSPPGSIEGMTYAGIDTVSLANNHSGNYGETGLTETQDLLDNAGIGVTGLGKLLVRNVDSTTFGFLGFEYVFRGERQSDLDLVKASEPLVDVLVIMVHWGDEYQSSANEFQRNLARKYVENGADLVVGHHPHWVQNVEVTDGVPVYYSLGNLVFDQMWSEETKKGIIVEFTFDGEKLVSEKVINTYIEEVGQPKVVDRN